MTIDLNSDVGESFGRWVLGDSSLLSLISSANVACGFHGGDPSVMRQTIRLAKHYGVTVGAHPGYADLRGFGRFDMEVPLDTLQDDILYQLGALQALCKVEDVKLAYVKPHGALYNRMAKDESVARAVANAIALFDKRLPVLVLAHSVAEEAAKQVGLLTKREGFIDRAYLPSGQLQPRSEAGSVIHDVAKAAERALQMVQRGKVQATDGSFIDIQADSLCIHGDSPNALETAKAVREGLAQANITIRSFVG